MSPILHGRVYAESNRSSLPRRQLRILLDPELIALSFAPRLADLHVLQEYLRSLPGPPCDVVLIAPVDNLDAPPIGYADFTWLNLQIVSFKDTFPEHISGAIGEWGQSFPKIKRLAATALEADADAVWVDTVPEAIDAEALDRTTGLKVVKWEDLKQTCQVFVRGYDVTWSFAHPVWGSPWTPFYSLSEPDLPLIGLWEDARALPLGPSGFEPTDLETLRSLALNRHAGLCYTRDKLLFFRAQDRVVRRHLGAKFDFAFQMGYHLNHYYVQLSAGLDQLCWAANAVFVLGFSRKDWRKVGVLTPSFLTRLREKSPAVADVFEEPAFVKWVKMLRGARNFVAHEGFSLPGEFYLTPAEEPTDAELGAEVEASAEWKELCEILPAGLLDQARATLKENARLRRYEKSPERVIKIQLDGSEVLIYPIINIEWDFEHFFGFAHRVAALGSERLRAQ